MSHITRQGLLLGGLGIAGATTLAACSSSGAPPEATIFGPPTPLATSPGQHVTTARLVAQETTLDLGGPTVATWTYGDTAPGPLIRATAGDLVRVTIEKRLPADTTIHWHGVALRNAADGVPGRTQDPIRPGSSYTYEFVAPDPGTYFYHPHVGVQLDRGLYAALIVDDPHESGAYDLEYVLVLDDWVDGTGRTPDDVLQALLDAGGAGTAGMPGIDHGAMGHGTAGMATGGWATGRREWPRGDGTPQVPSAVAVVRRFMSHASAGAPTLSLPAHPRSTEKRLTADSPSSNPKMKVSGQATAPAKPGVCRVALRLRVPG